MRFIFAFLVLFTAGQSWATSDDWVVPARGNGGSVIIAPKNATGTAQTLMTFDPVNGVSGSGFAGKNYIINGDMTFFQRGTVFTSIVTAQYSVDRYRYDKSGTMVHEVGLSNDVPTLAQSKWASTNSFNMTLTTPQASIGSSDWLMLSHRVEGYNWAALYGKTFTLSFWVKATQIGLYNVALRSGSVDATYIAQFPVNVTDTWEKKIITVPAPTIGTWDLSTGIGLMIGWHLVCGSSLQAPSVSTWVAGSYHCGAGQVNGVQSGATNFKLAQVMLNEGSVAAPFQLAGGTIGGELLLAQRYYEKSYRLSVAVPTAGDNGSIYVLYGALSTAQYNYYVPFRVAKRTPTPTIYLYDSAANGGTGAAARCNRATGNITCTANFPSEIGFTNYITDLTSAYGFQFHWAADAEL